MVVVLGRLRHRAGRLELDALVHEQGGVTAVVEDHVRAEAVAEVEQPLGAPPVLLQRLALPGEDRDARGGLDGAAGPTTTAAAASSWVEKMLQDTQRTSAPSATSVSISTAVCTVMCSEPAIRAPRSGLDVAELLAQRHQAGHLVLGQAQLVTAGLGQREVRDRELEAVDRSKFVADMKRAPPSQEAPLQSANPGRAWRIRFVSGPLQRLSTGPFHHNPYVAGAQRGFSANLAMIWLADDVI